MGVWPCWLSSFQLLVGKFWRKIFGENKNMNRLSYWLSSSRSFQCEATLCDQVKPLHWNFLSPYPVFEPQSQTNYCNHLGDRLRLQTAFSTRSHLSADVTHLLSFCCPRTFRTIWPNYISNDHHDSISQPELPFFFENLPWTYKEKVDDDSTKLFSRLRFIEKLEVVFQLQGFVSAFKIIHFPPFCFGSVECKNVYMWGFFLQDTL